MTHKYIVAGIPWGLWYLWFV